MLMADALTHAIDYLRATTEDATLLQAAKVLDRRAQRMRARTERLPHDVHWCECGAAKPAKQVACSACYALIPMAVLVARITGKPTAKRRAEDQIEAICRARIGAGEGMAA